VKHAIKSDIPSITDSVSKLVHIGKATVEKLNNLRQAAMDEGFMIQVGKATVGKQNNSRQVVEPWLRVS